MPYRTIDLSGVYTVASVSGPAGEPPWTPAALFTGATDGGWWDPSDLSTLFQDGAGTQPVTAVGQPVAHMRDKSGRNSHVAQGDSLRWPTLQQDEAGRYYLAFDGAYDGLGGRAFGYPFDRVSALRLNAMHDQGDRYFFAASNYFGLMGIVAGQLVLHNGALQPSMAVPAIGETFIATERHAGATSRLALNEAAYVVGDSGSGVPDNHLIGRGSHDMSDPNFRFYGAVAVNRPLTDAEIMRARHFLGQKSGKAMTAPPPTPGTLAFEDAQTINPNWAYVDLDGSGSTGYSQNISMILTGANSPVDLGGTYQIASVSADQITLVNPEAENADWQLLGDFPDQSTQLLSAYVVKPDQANWIGPFIVEAADTALLVANFVALQGLYKSNGDKQSPFPISVQLEATPVDGSDQPIGPPQLFGGQLEGNRTGRDTRAITLVCQLNQPGRQSVRARRTTNADLKYEGTVVDEVKWKELYGVSEVDLEHFGNVTTVRARTYATEGALNLKERQLNMLATRRVPIRTAGDNFGPLAPTTNAADIFAAICRDPQIGARKLSELDLDAIYGAVAEAVDYFGYPDAGKFSHTFDSDNLSFEETAAIVAQAVFCTAFRQGSKIRLELERATEASALLFNHRNKLPGSERRTVRFGNLDENDGVEFSYIDPADDAKVTIYIPSDKSAIKPRAIEGVGIRSHEQAYWAAWRAWNKIRYQNTTAEFTALQEAAVVIRNNRVLVADNTRPETQDGEIRAQQALELELSQPAELAPGAAHTIFLQLPDGRVDAIGITPGSSDRHVVLARAPLIGLALDPDGYALPTYQIVRNDSPDASAFLISEKEPADDFNYTIRAVNYSPLYYLHDQLILWLNFEAGYLDAAPFLYDGLPAGGSVIAIDPQRGRVHIGGPDSSVALQAFNAPESYTKACWIRRGNLGQAGGSILGSAAELFGFGTSTVRGGHGGTQVEADWPAALAWHHVALSYDAEDARMVLFLDGLERDSAEDVPARALGQLTALVGLEGRADDLRLIRRAISPAEALELYRSSRL